MYTCIVFFSSDEQKKEALKLLNSRIIHSRNLMYDCVHLRTRKLWKFFWFNYHFRKYSKTFSYIEYSRPCRSIVISNFVSKNFKHNIELADGYTQKLSVYFSNIHNVWKIRLSMLLKN